MAIAARLYMSDYDGGLFHHHEGWVLALRVQQLS